MLKIEKAEEMKLLKNVNARNDSRPMKYFVIGIFALGMVFFSACSKDEGVGGRATIEGKLYVQDYNLEGELKAEYYGADEDVFIVYGDDTFYGDNIKTHHDGTYRFEFLNTGTYQIYAYSRCDECPSEVEPIFIDVTISESNEVVRLEDLVIKK